MTDTFFDQGSDTRIFVLSVLGSLLLHGLLVAGLASMPKTTIVKDEPPTVQVTLLPAPENPQTPQTEKLPLPHTVKQKASPTPIPLAPLHRPQPPTPPLQASLKPSQPMERSPLPSPVQAKPILQDTRASQALKVRKMMKMRVPIKTRQATPSLPTKTTRTYSQNRVVPPLPTMRKERLSARSLPTPPTLTTPQTLMTAPPSVTRSTVTRPNIITSSRPAYPRVARESGWEGTVIVRTLIDTNGNPSQIKIRKSCGHPTLDQAAQNAIQRWKFQPAKDGNIPISKWVDIPVKFDLNS